MPQLKKVLVVDDSEINRRILFEILKKDYQIIEAKNGKECLDILNTEENIAVVLLDIIMPVVDGYEVLAAMRKEGKFAKIPVIVTSGQSGEKAEVKALALGANDYVHKPYNPDNIKHRVANTLYLCETAAIVNSAQKDMLTGAYNKEYFYLQAKEMIRKNPDKHYDIFCCDIERFKLVNDLYGVQTGDQLLKYLADMLVDFVGTKGICGRLGGDVFAGLIEQLPQYEESRFKEALDYINQFDVNLNILLRYGIYRITDPTVPVNIMCDRANLAKQSIKGKYGVYFAYYNDQVRTKLLEEEFISSNMKTALKEKQFQIYFQPKYDLKTEEIVGAEALVRWFHPEKGVLSPGYFIPIFEKNGFITDLDFYIWEECCKKMRAWIDLGNTVTPISVNVSRADIYHPDLDHILLSMIKKYQLSPKYLHLEITETAYTENPEQLIAVVSKLKKLGFIIEMDDFGTGYSSLNMLSELPIDVLKLDMTFIQSEEDQGGNRGILSFIITLAKWLNLAVIAEGVETEAQVKLLRNLNCEYVQGFYYAKPLSQKQFEHLLEKAKIQALKVMESKLNVDSNRHIGDSNKQALLLLGLSTQECRDFEDSFGEDYHVLRLYSAKEVAETILQEVDKPSVLITAYFKERTAKDLAEIQKRLKGHSLPVITIHDQGGEGVEEGMAQGVFDYVLRPYLGKNLKNRIENVIYRTQISEFQREKEISAAVKSMKKRAEEDGLTGLLNRIELEKRIEGFFDQNTNPRGMFIIFDIDNFKQINDTFGHLLGDQVLRTIARALNTVFPETTMIGRIGGDEYALFIPYRLEEGVIARKMEQLCREMKLEEIAVQISYSAGICFSPDFGQCYETLYNNADIALLTSKRRGKNQYQIYKEGMDLPSGSLVETKETKLLDGASEAVFVSDAFTGEIIYINAPASEILCRSKEQCLGRKCHNLFWDREVSCDRCSCIEQHRQDYYEEDTLFGEEELPIHIKAKTGEWENREVRIHYIRVGK